MKVLVTGANGYIGKGVVKKLLDDGLDVVAVDLDTNQVDPRAKRIDCNIFSDDIEILKNDCPEILLHLAWRDGFKHSSISHLKDLPKHYEFIKNCVDLGVKQIAILGSMHEIGFHEGSINEDTPTNPLSLYGIGKNALREATQLLATDRSIIFQWIRGFYIISNSPFGDSIFSKISQAANRGEKKFPFTSGKNQYDFIDYDSFCVQVAAVIEQTEITGIINCCSGFPQSLKFCVENYIEKNNYKIELDYGAYPDRPYDSKAIWGDNKKIVEILERKGL